MTSTSWRSYALAGALAVVANVSQVQAGALVLREKPGHITEAEIEVDATPAEVYAVVTDYAHWPTIFTDVPWVTVVTGGRETARVKFRSRALEHQVTVEFDNLPNHLVRFHGVEGPRGGRANGTYRLTPLDGGARTLVSASLYLNVVGAPGLFVTDRKLRAFRQAKLRADSIDLARRFAARSPTS